MPMERQVRFGCPQNISGVFTPWNIHCSGQAWSTSTHPVWGERTILQILSFLISLGSQGFWRIRLLRTSGMETIYVFWGVVYFRFYTSPHLLLLSTRRLFCCETPEKFCGPDLPLTWGWVDNDWILIIGWTCPLKLLNLYTPELDKFRSIQLGVHYLSVSSFTSQWILH